jgi:hypothetical protein
MATLQAARSGLFWHQQKGGVPYITDVRAVSGNNFFVDANASDAGTSAGYGQHPDKPFSTLDSAFAQCTANQGDTIWVLPGHSETVTGAGGIAHDVAGVSVIGLGRGNARPTFLMDAGTAVTYAISAASARVENIVLKAGHNGIVAGVDITAAYAWLKDVEFQDNTTDEHFLTPIKATSTSDGNADGLRIEGCKYITVDSGALEFIEINADVDDLQILNNVYIADAATAAKLLLSAAAKTLTGVQIEGNRLVSGITSGDILVDNGQADNTGYAAFNFAGHHVTSNPTLIDCDGIRMFENYSAQADTVTGAIEPAADSIT